MRIYILILSCILVNQLYGATRSIRSEIHRYTLLRDKVLAERDLRKIDARTYFNLDAHISSGLRAMIGDVKGISEDTTKTDIQKETEILGALNQNLNTEKYLDVDLEFGAALPRFNLWGYKHDPGLLFNINIGSSLSIINDGTATNALAQIYLKTEQKIGLYTTLSKPDSKYSTKISLYKMQRNDLYSQSNSSQIRQDKKLINVDSTSIRKQNTYSTDLLFSYKDKDYLETEFLIRGLKLKTNTTKNGDLYYGNRPLVRYLIKMHFKKHFRWIPYAGISYRQRYTVDKGIYAGFIVEGDSSPFRFNTMIDTEFLTIVPQFKWKFINLVYSMKIPFRNGSGNVWTSNIYALNLRVFF